MTKIVFKNLMTKDHPTEIKTILDKDKAFAICTEQQEWMEQDCPDDQYEIEVYSTDQAIYVDIAAIGWISALFAINRIKRAVKKAEKKVQPQ